MEDYYSPQAVNVRTSFTYNCSLTIIDAWLSHQDLFIVLGDLSAKVGLEDVRTWRTWRTWRETIEESSAAEEIERAKDFCWTSVWIIISVWLALHFIRVKQIGSGHGNHGHRMVKQEIIMINFILVNKKLQKSGVSMCIVFSKQILRQVTKWLSINDCP